MPDSTIETIQQFEEFRSLLKEAKKYRSKFIKNDSYDILIGHIGKTYKKSIKNKSVTEENILKFFKESISSIGDYIQNHSFPPKDTKLTKNHNNRIKVASKLLSKMININSELKNHVKDAKFEDIIKQKGNLVTDSVLGMVVLDNSVIFNQFSAKIGLTVVISDLPFANKQVVKFPENSKTYLVSKVVADAVALKIGINTYVTIYDSFATKFALNFLTLKNELSLGNIN